MIISLVCLASLFSAQAEARQADTDFSAVDAYVESQMKDLHIPGMALGIVQGDQVAYVHGYGEAGPGKRLVTPQTPFMIGSVSKSFTALAVMQLVEAGKIDLDAPVQTYLPWFRVADAGASAQITVRHLLNQNSGLSRESGLEEETASDLSDEAIESGVRRLADDELSRAPGTTFEYSNVNFNILGLIVQTLSGQSYESYIQEHVFDPLGDAAQFYFPGPGRAGWHGQRSLDVVWDSARQRRRFQSRGFAQRLFDLQRRRYGPLSHCPAQ